MDADLEKIVIGQIKKIEKHPDADKLIICQGRYWRGISDPDRYRCSEMSKKETRFLLFLDGGRGRRS